MDDIVYIIRKDSKIIGSMHAKEGYFLSAIVDVIDILDNYNANLVNSKMNNSLLAIRMFEKENERGDKSLAFKPALCTESRNSIADFFPTFRLTSRDKTDADFGSIGTTNRDIAKSMTDAGCGVEINLDTCRVSFVDLCFKYGYRTWEEKFKMKKSELKLSPYDITDVAFNELDDLFEFVKENICGWLTDKMPDAVYVPTYIDM